MRKTAMAVTLRGSFALGQALGAAPGQAASSIAPPPPRAPGASPNEGSPMLPGTRTGLDIIADKGLNQNRTIGALQSERQGS